MVSRRTTAALVILVLLATRRRADLERDVPQRSQHDVARVAHVSTDIAVIVDDATDVEAVLKAALDEARLRNATLLVLKVPPPRSGEVAPDEIDRRLTVWVGRYPDVQTHTLVVPDDIPTFLAERDPPVQLTVMGNAEGAEAVRLVSPYGRFALRDTQCSVMLVRP